jgi:hypothetical protein
MFTGLLDPDPDPLVRDTDPAPDEEPAVPLPCRTAEDGRG